MSEPRDVVLSVLSEITGEEAERLRPEQDLVADLSIDSPKALRLLVELEERLDLEIEDEDAARMSTVGDVLAYVAAHAG